MCIRDRLIASEERAAKLLARLTETSLATSTEQVSLGGAGRSLRCTLSRGDNGTLALMLEDITERRALEQDMLSRQIAALDAKTSQSPKTETFPAGPAAAFENLGKAITETMKAQDLPLPPLVVEDAAIEPVKVPFVPATIRNSLERTGKAILVMRQGEALFATSHAAAAIGHNDVASLFADRAVWQALDESGNGATLSLSAASGEVEAFDVKRAQIPWLSGPADQFVLQGFSALTPTVAVDVKQPMPVDEVAPPLVERPLIEAPLKRMEPSRATIAHEELKAILDVANDGIITLNSEGQILSFSAGAQAIFGQNEKDVVKRPLILSLIHI
jgi:PAS domain-containing protein